MSRTSVSRSNSFALRLPGVAAQHATRRARRTRRWVVVLVVCAAAALLGAFLGGVFTKHSTDASAHGALADTGASAGTLSAAHGGQGAHTSGRTTAAGASRGAVAGSSWRGYVLTTSLSPYPLAAPISSAPVVASGNSELVILGGVTSSGAAAEGVFGLDPGDGALAHLANLGEPVESAAAALVDGGCIAMGGASPAPTQTVYEVPGGASCDPGESVGTRTTSVAVAATIGSLPQPRAGADAVTWNGTVYLVGGYAGSEAVPSVLATATGSGFSAVANLVEPVRNAAAAALDGDIYVFGGEVAQSGTWAPVDTIQEIDPSRHSARIVGRMPEAVSGSSAVTVDGMVLVIGGSTAAGSAVPTVWEFGARGGMRPAAQLAQPVAEAGAAVLGSTVWVIGGESNGTSVTAVQSVAVTRAPAVRSQSRKVRS